MFLFMWRECGASGSDIAYWPLLTIIQQEEHIYIKPAYFDWLFYTYPFFHLTWCFANVAEPIYHWDPRLNSSGRNCCCFFCLGICMHIFKNSSKICYEYKYIVRISRSAKKIEAILMIFHNEYVRIFFFFVPLCVSHSDPRFNIGIKSKYTFLRKKKQSSQTDEGEIKRSTLLCKNIFFEYVFVSLFIELLC